MPLTVMLLSSDEARLSALKDSLQAAGFIVVSARGIPEAFGRVNAFDVSAVVVDSGFGNDSALFGLRLHYSVLTLEADCELALVGSRLRSMFTVDTELVQ